MSADRLAAAAPARRWRTEYTTAGLSVMQARAQVMRVGHVRATPDFTTGPTIGCSFRRWPRTLRAGSPQMSPLPGSGAPAPGAGPSHEVAMCATGDSPQAMESANARLIAAAPELYKAARLAEAALARGRWIEGSTDPEAVALFALFALRAALAHAEGGAQ